MSYRGVIRILLAATAFTSFAARSQDLLECVDPDVRAGLLGSVGQPAATTTVSVPDYLQALVLPSTLNLIGTTDSGLLTVTAFRSPSDPEPALAAVTESLRAADWVSLGEPAGIPPTGFVAQAEAQPETAMMCKDDTVLQALSGRRNGITYVSLRKNNFTAGRAGMCEQLLAGA